MLLSNGDGEAFEKLYRLHSARLLGYLIKLVKSENIASELLQDAFVKIWNNRHNLDPNLSFRSYLFRISENMVYDFFRKAARDKKLQETLIHNAIHQYTHVEEILSRKENVQLLQDVLSALPPKRRQVFQLIKIEEKSYAEVSDLLHISISTINDHVVKATKFIRENLERYHIATIIVLFCYPYHNFCF